MPYCANWLDKEGEILKVNPVGSGRIKKLSKALRHLRAQVLSLDNRAGNPRQVPSELAYPLSLFLIARLRTFYVGSH